MTYPRSQGKSEASSLCLPRPPFHPSQRHPHVLYADFFIFRRKISPCPWSREQAALGHTPWVLAPSLSRTRPSGRFHPDAECPFLTAPSS